VATREAVDASGLASEASEVNVRALGNSLVLAGLRALVEEGWLGRGSEARARLREVVELWRRRGTSGVVAA
jgi:hypothetical protein